MSAMLSFDSDVAKTDRSCLCNARCRGDAECRVQSGGASCRRESARRRLRSRIAVGSQDRVLAVDVSEPMLALATMRCEGLEQVRFEQADACALPAEDGAYDVACILQVYCYVKDVDRALGELRRALKPGSRAIVLDSDFSGVLWETGDRRRMRKVLDAYALEQQRSFFFAMNRFMFVAMRR